MKHRFIQDTILEGRYNQVLCASDVTVPATLDLRDLVLKTEDQGSSPKCCAYTGTSWLEAIMWRRTGKPRDYDPDELYAQAKKIDGLPNQDGTTLRAILMSMIALQWVDRSVFDMRVEGADAMTLKRAIHRYGTVLLAMNIGDQWNSHYGILDMTLHGMVVGGHAVTCCGYDRKGVFIQNSWGTSWGKYGFARISWDVFDKEFCEMGYFKNILDGMEE